MNTIAYLTESGNLMHNAHPEMPYAFYNPKGKFLRWVGKEQADYLKTVCPKIEINEPVHGLFDFQMASLWVPIFEVSHVDDTNYKKETGDDYSFTTYHEYYARVVSGNLQVCRLTRKCTSAQSPYCTFNGRFCNYLEAIIFHDVVAPEEERFYSNYIMVDETHNHTKEEEDNLLNYADIVPLHEVLSAFSSHRKGDDVLEVYPTLTELLNRVRAIQEVSAKASAFYLANRGRKGRRTGRGRRRERKSLLALRREKKKKS